MPRTLGAEAKAWVIGWMAQHDDCRIIVCACRMEPGSDQFSTDPSTLEAGMNGQLGQSQTTPTTEPEEDIDVTAAEEINTKLDTLLRVFGNFLTTPDEEQGFVELLNRVYQNVLGRDADPTAQQGYLPLLKSGGITEDGIKAALIASPEYAQRWLTNFYKAHLGRLPRDSSELDYWVTVSRSTGLDGAGAEIVATAEGQQYSASHPA